VGLRGQRPGTRGTEPTTEDPGQASHGISSVPEWGAGVFGRLAVARRDLRQPSRPTITSPAPGPPKRWRSFRAPGRDHESAEVVPAPFGGTPPGIPLDLDFAARRRRPRVLVGQTFGGMLDELRGRRFGHALDRR